MFRLFRKRWFWVTTAVILVGGGLWYREHAHAGPYYETEPVVRQDLFQTVDVTGEISPQDRVELSFQTSGRLVALPVHTGQAVKKGDLLAEVEVHDLAFAAQRAAANLSMVRAQLQARLAGETKESIRIAQAAVEQAQASYGKAVVDLGSMRQTVVDEHHVSEIALHTAESNLRNAGATSDQSVKNAYDSLRTALQTSEGALQIGLSDGDAIIGVDNTAANDYYENILGLNDRLSLSRARTQYPLVRQAQASAVMAIRRLVVSSPQREIHQAADAMLDALSLAQTYLDDVQRTLAGTITNTNLTASDLAAKKSMIEANRASVSAQLSVVVNAKQAVTNAELSRTTTRAQLENAVETARKNVDIAERNRTTNVQAAETTVEIQRASLQSAKASLELKLAPLRAVDLGPLRAQVRDAEVAWAQAMDRLHDARLMAPTDGIVMDILPAIGEQVAMHATVMKMIGHETFKVEGLVPEADIVKVRVGQTATLTLDAFGDQETFIGTVLSEDPDQTKVQDAIYYKVRIGLDVRDKAVKPGMTANVTIQTDERKSALIIPARSLRQQDTTYSVRVLEGTVPRDVTVEIGLRGDEGRVEVRSGLTESQMVITGELTKEEYVKRQMEKK
mgnify:CR=1 FL=1